MGGTLEIELVRWGFYPAGGGQIEAQITPTPQPKPFVLVDRGYLDTMRPVAVVSALPRGIGKRELKAVARGLGLGRQYGRVIDVDDPRGPGNVVMVEVVSQHCTELFTGFGEKGVRAEQVAERVSRDVLNYLDAGVPVGPHLADQLLLLMAIAGGGRFRTVEPDPHTPTNAAVIQAFLDLDIRIERIDDRVWEIGVNAS
jgi:RNA 3'-terminal phosphate cyclase (ATP)